MSDKFVNKRQYTSQFNIIDNSTTDECVLTQDEIDYIRAGQLLYTMSLETAFDEYRQKKLYKVIWMNLNECLDKEILVSDEFGKVNAYILLYSLK